MSVVKSIQLGSKRFLEVNDEYDVVIKAEGNTKRAHFTASRWARFIGEIPEVDDAIKRFCDDKPTAFKKHIGGKWYISVSSEVPCVDIRRWYMKDNSVHPTTIGIRIVSASYCTYFRSVGQTEGCCRRVTKGTTGSCCYITLFS